MNRQDIYIIFFDRIKRNIDYLEEIVFPVIETGRQLQILLTFLDEIRHYKYYLTILELFEMETLHYIMWDTSCLDFLLQD